MRLLDPNSNGLEEIGFQFLLNGLTNRTRGELFHGDEWANFLLHHPVAEGVPHEVIVQLVGDGGHDHALVDSDNAAGDNARRHIHGVMEAKWAIDWEAGGQSME